MAVAITRTDDPSGVNASGNVATYTNAAIGTAHPDRIVVVCVGTELAGATIDSCTIGGSAMNAGTAGSASPVYARLFYKAWPTGTTATIAVTFGGNPDSTQNHIAVYNVSDGAFSSVGADTSTDQRDDAVTTGSTTVAAGGGILGVFAAETDTTDRTWNNWTENLDADYGAFRFGTGLSITAGSATRTVSGGGNNEDAALSWIIFTNLAPSSSASPSKSPSRSPSRSPSLSPSISPSLSPSVSPSRSPSRSPSISPSVSPSASLSPSKSPSRSPSLSPSKSPSRSPSKSPSLSPSISPSPAASWYNVSWGYRVKVTVLATKVDADLTDFPVYVDLNDLPAGFHTHVNQTDARDIRVTTSNGTSEVPREVVFYDAATDTGELHFKGTIDGDDNTDFYIYYGNEAATEPAIDSTYGAENVWDANYVGVWHYAVQPNNNAGQILDSTTNDNDAHSHNMEGDERVAGKVGYALNLGGTDENVVAPNSATLETNNITVSAWVKQNIPDSAYVSFVAYGTHAAGGWLIQRAGDSTDHLRVSWNNAFFDGSTANALKDTSWHYVAFNRTDSTNAIRIFLDGAYETTSSTPTDIDFSSYSNDISMGSRAADQFMTGLLDEVRMSNIPRADTWISTEYNNQSAPGDFFAIWAEEESPESASLSPSRSSSISPSASLSPSKSPSLSPSKSPSVSPSASLSASKSPSISPSISPSASLSASKSPSLSPSISPSASISPSKSASKSPSKSPSLSPSVSPSASLSPSKSASLSPSKSPSLSPSVSPSASLSPSISASKSPSLSPSISPSVSPSASLSASKSPSISPSVSPSASLSPSKSPSISPSVSPSASLSPSKSSSISPSLSPSAVESESLSPSLSASISQSISASVSPSASLSPSRSPSKSPSLSASKSASISASVSASISPSKSASKSPSVSPSVSPSASLSPSISPSPSAGWTNYTRGDYNILPSDDTDLENAYTAGDVADVATADDERVCQTATNEFMIHQFKDYIGSLDAVVLTCELQTNVDPSASTVYLQIYNRDTTTWDEVDTYSLSTVNTDFVLTGEVADTAAYVDGSGVISCRVYQEAQ